MNKNWQIKALAFFSAILLWVFVVGVENNVSIFPQGLEVRVASLSDNLSIIGEKPTVKLRIKAPNVDLKDINVSDFEVSVSGEGLIEGRNIAEVTAISKNPLISIVDIEPAEVAVELEAVSSKEVPVVVEVSGSPADGFEYDSLFVDSDIALLKGKSSQLNTIDELSFVIELTGKENSSFSRVLRPDLEGVEISPEQFFANVTVKELVIDEEVNEKEVVSELVSKKFMVEVNMSQDSELRPREIVPKNVVIELEGSLNDLENVSEDQLLVLLEEKLLKDGKIKINPNDIAVPFGLSVISIEPQELEVKL